MISDIKDVEWIHIGVIGATEISIKTLTINVKIYIDT